MTASEKIEREYRLTRRRLRYALNGSVYKHAAAIREQAQRLRDRPSPEAVALFAEIAESKEFTAEAAYKDFGHLAQHKEPTP